MTSKQRAYLKGLAMDLTPVFQIGKSSVTPENVEAIAETFNTRELIARILVQLRKEKNTGNHKEESTLSVGDLTLDPLSLNVIVQSQVIKLTKTEYVILKLLMSHSKYTISKDLLLDSISYETPDCTEKSLKQHIYNLRKKLNSIGSNIQIETVRGVGFKLSENKA